MKAVIQRVSSASVVVDGKIVAQIGRGLLVLLGIGRDDSQEKDYSYLINKILKLRVFPGDGGHFETSVIDVQGEILLVSQFTLYGDCTKGNRPSFCKAMAPAQAQQVYNAFAKDLKTAYSHVKEGVFGAYMQVSLVNDGPATFIVCDRSK